MCILHHFHSQGTFNLEHSEYYEDEGDDSSESLPEMSFSIDLTVFCRPFVESLVRR